MVNFQFSELKDCFNGLSNNPDCRAIVLSGAGKHFTAGLDLQSSLEMGQELAAIEEIGRRGNYMEKKIKDAQVSRKILGPEKPLKN